MSRLAVADVTAREGRWAPSVANDAGRVVGVRSEDRPIGFGQAIWSPARRFYRADEATAPDLDGDVVLDAVVPQGACEGAGSAPGGGNGAWKC